MDNKSGTPASSKKDVLSQVHFGGRIAEQESKHLLEYFVETEQWKSILRGEVDVVYGSKGSTGFWTQLDPTPHRRRRRADGQTDEK